MSDFKAKVHQIQFSLQLRSRSRCIRGLPLRGGRRNGKARKGIKLKGKERGAHRQEGGKGGRKERSE